MSISYNSPEKFTEAANSWHLEKLYFDLSNVKGRGLTALEKMFLQGLLCGYSPAEIAEKIYHNRKSNSVRVYLSSGIYKYIQELFIRQFNKTIKIKNWSRVAHLLAQAGYKKEHVNILNSPFNASRIGIKNNASLPLKKDWEEQIDLQFFVGRQQELKTLETWIVKSRFRLVTVSGMAGLGKTSLAIKLVERIQDQFEYVIWRSLQGMPDLKNLLTDIIKVFSIEEQTPFPLTTTGKLSLLMNILRSYRCLLILDRAESLFISGKKAGKYHPKTQEYSMFIQRLGGEFHQSCCLLTTREKSREIVFFEETLSTVKNLSLQGLRTVEIQRLPDIEHLVGSQKQKQKLIELYANNPLAVKKISLIIDHFFNGKITEFLGTDTILISDIYDIFEQQFNRLSPREQQVLYILAIRQRFGENSTLLDKSLFQVHLPESLDILASLEWRGFIQTRSHRLTQSPLLIAYILEKLVNQVYLDIPDQNFGELIKQMLQTMLRREV